jgi:8-oxo-dGTP pyrophosphatase MutT (NUDIX family)
MPMKRERVMIKKRMKNPINPVDAAGGVLFRNVENQPEVLLIYRNGVWDLPKGKKESEESFEMCAVREMREEVGIEDVQIIDYIMDTYHEYEINGKKEGKTTKWYAMKSNQLSQKLIPQKEEGITDVRWKPLTHAKEIVGYENLIEVLKKFEALNKKKRTS